MFTTNNRLTKNMLMSHKLLFLGTLFFMGLSLRISAQTPTANPSFQIKGYQSTDGFTGPTKDKPQSKLWFMDNKWWAILPDSDGVPSLWERSENGWVTHDEISSTLKNVPGQADVWYEKRQATAVGVSDSSIVVFRLEPKDLSDRSWKGRVLGKLTLPKLVDPRIETATIAKDNDGVWWVAADVGENAVYVWSSKDEIHWGSPMVMVEGIDADDISCIVALEHSTLVLWSNQTGDYYVDSREHRNGEPEGSWSVIKRVASGNRTADDHINTALSTDGTLWVVTKNEVDEIGKPNLVLRVRSPYGEWENFSYLNNEEGTWPSRPVVIATPDPQKVLAGHTIYNKKERNKGGITFGIIDTTASEILVHQKTVIAPTLSEGSLENDITGPKLPFPAVGPWIILASDDKGNVYEADLRPFFEDTINK